MLSGVLSCIDVATVASARRSSVVRRMVRQGGATGGATPWCDTMVLRVVRRVMREGSATGGSTGWLDRAARPWVLRRAASATS